MFPIRARALLGLASRAPYELFDSADGKVFIAAANDRLFARIWFNEITTEGGREALGAYHERKDDARNIGLGPEHDWASHGADAFGLMCVAYEEPQVKRDAKRTPRHQGETAWMG